MHMFEIQTSEQIMVTGVIFISSLRISYMYTMHSDHVHLTFTKSSIFTSTSQPLPISCPLCFIYNPPNPISAFHMHIGVWGHPLELA